MRLAAPRTLDFAQLADGVRRNNVGIAGISLQAEARFADGRVTLQPTGQSWPLAGAAPADGWCQLTVLDWDTSESTSLEAVAALAPTGGPAPAPAAAPATTPATTPAPAADDG